MIPNELKSATMGARAPQSSVISEACSFQLINSLWAFKEASMISYLFLFNSVVRDCTSLASEWQHQGM